MLMMAAGTLCSAWSWCSGERVQPLAPLCRQSDASCSAIAETTLRCLLPRTAQHLGVGIREGTFFDCTCCALDVVVGAANLHGQLERTISAFAERQ